MGANGATRRRGDALRTLHAPATCEALEGRRLLNVDLSYTGSTDDDVYTVRLKADDPSRLEVVESLGGGAETVQTHPLADVDSLTIESLSGFDLLIVDESNGPVALPMGIFYDGGNDFDELIWNAGPGEDAISIYYNVLIDDDSVIEVASVENVTVNGNDGADTIEVDSTAPSISWLFNGGDGNDALNFVSGDLDIVEGEVTFNGGAGADSIHLDDSFNDYADDYDITPTFVGRFEFEFNYFAAEALVLDGQLGSNNFLLAGMAAGTAMTINGGDGADYLFINAAPSSPLEFNGGLDPADVDFLFVNAGTYTFNSDAAAGTAHLVVHVNNGASVIFNASQHLRNLSINNSSALVSTSGSRVIVIETIDIQGSGKLDLRDNDLIVVNGDLGTWSSSEYSGVTGMVQSGRNGGDWSGGGIVTSMSSAISPQMLTTLGVASASQVFGIAAAQSALWQGESVTGDSVLVKYTYAGDANLSGHIDADDYFAIDSNYSKSGSVFGYFYADFDYNGAIDGDDFHVIDTNFAPAGSGGPLAPPADARVLVWFVPAPTVDAAEVDRALREELFA